MVNDYGFEDLKAKDILEVPDLRRKALMLLRRMDVADAYGDAPILEQLWDESRWEWSPYTRDEKRMRLARHGSIVVDGSAVLTIWLSVATDGSNYGADITGERECGRSQARGKHHGEQEP